MSHYRLAGVGYFVYGRSPARTGDDPKVAATLMNLAGVPRLKGDLEQAESDIHEALRVFQESFRAVSANVGSGNAALAVYHWGC